MSDSIHLLLIWYCFDNTIRLYLKEQAKQILVNFFMITF